MAEDGREASVILFRLRPTTIREDGRRPREGGVDLGVGRRTAVGWGGDRVRRFNVGFDDGVVKLELPVPLESLEVAGVDGGGPRRGVDEGGERENDRVRRENSEFFGL